MSFLMWMQWTQIMPFTFLSLTNKFMIITEKQLPVYKTNTSQRKDKRID